MNKPSIEKMYWILLVTFILFGLIFGELFHKNLIIIIVGIGILSYILKSHIILLNEIREKNYEKRK